jgi:hypothetical protein
MVKLRFHSDSFFATEIESFFFEGQQKLKDGDMAIFSMEDWSRELPLVDSST